MVCSCLPLLPREVALSVTGSTRVLPKFTFPDVDPLPMLMVVPRTEVVVPAILTLAPSSEKFVV